MSQLESKAMILCGAAFLMGMGVAVFGFYDGPIIPEAHATPAGMQSATSGGQPHVNLTGKHESSSELVLYTVPSDRVFILTGAVGWSSNTAAGYDILEGATLRIGRDYIVHPLLMSNAQRVCNYLCRNNAHIVFGSGTQVILAPYDSSSSHKYMLEGYLANPGS